MSDSKYLPYQNPFSELETECNPLAEPAPEATVDCPPCPAECTPNPDAIVPDWTKRRLNEAFLNEKTCQYWITSRVAWDDGDNPTYYTSTGASELENRMQQYIAPAVTAFLMNNGKPYDSSTVAAIANKAVAEDYYLSERPGIKMRVLVTLPYDILNDISDAAPSTVASGEKTVDINMSSFKNTYEKVAHILDSYSRHQGLWSRTESGKIIFEDNKPLNLQDEYGYFKEFAAVFLDFFSAQDIEQAETVTLDFTATLELKAVTITKNKYSDPIIFDGAKLSSLQQTFPFNNPTTMGYISNINLMSDDIDARGGPKPWLEFVQDHTYPTVRIDYGIGAGGLEESLLSPALDNLNTGDVFGSLFDNLVSLPDALTYLYDQSLSMTPDQREEILANINDTALLEQLQDEALFNEDFDNSDFFAKLPDIMKEVTSIKELFTEIFDNLKISGLFNLLSSCLESLSIGLDFEELIEQACTAAINSMDMTSFGKLWASLPAAEIDTIMAEITAQLGEEIIAPWDIVAQTKSLTSQLKTISLGVFGENLIVAEAILNALSTMDVDCLDTASMQSALESFGGIQAALDALPKGSSTTQLDSALSTSDMTDNSYTDNVTIPSDSEVNEIIDRIQEALSTIPPVSTTTQSEDNGFGGSSSSSGVSNYGLAPSIGGVSSGFTMPDVVFGTYVSALLSYYSVNGFGNVLGALNKLPGAQVLANIIATVESPIPPPFGPSIMDNIKSLDLDFGRNTISITLPDMRNPVAFLPNIKDYFKYVIVLAKYTIEQVLLAALKALMIKILELLYSALNKLLATAANESAALMSGEQADLYDMVKKSFCAADATDEEVEDTLNGLMASLGVTDASTAGELSSADGLNSLVVDISAVLTEEEMADLILGNPTPDSLSLVQEIIEIENPAYKSSFANKAQIASVFRNVGSLLPSNFKSDLRERVRPRLKPKPSSPTICSSTQDLENWRNARAALLKHNADISGDTVTDEQIEEQWNKLRDRIKEDFNAVSNILQKGPGQFLQDALPPLMAGPPDPDCPDCPDPQEAGTALLPREPKELAQVLSSATNTLFGGIEAAHVSDLLGRRGFANMLLSDTLAMPYTRHNSRVGSIFSPTYVHTEDQTHSGLLGVLQTFAKIPIPAGPGFKAVGMLPIGVASHLRNELVNLRDTSIATNTDYVDDFSALYEPLGITEDELMAMGTIPSKEPDLVLEFRDNNQDGSGDGDEYKYGFDINFEYWTYTYEGGAPVVNVDDVSQLKIVDRYQRSAFGGAATLEDSEAVMTFTSKGTLSSAASIEKSKYDLSGAKFSPQIECFGQILMESLRQSECNEEAIEAIGVHFGGSIEFWDNIMNRALAYFASSIADDEILWTHGGSPAPITNNDVIYLEPDAAVGNNAKDKLYGSSLDGLGIGTTYLEALKAKKDIGPLGTSARVDEGTGEILEIPHPRVTYLDPQVHGGNYMRPPYYVSPPAPTGWTGILQALVPEVAGKDPQPQKLITFADITDRVSKVFDNLADDPRLSQDQDSVKELPYARILDRTAASNIEGVISALIRIYVSEEFIKALPVFGKFALPTAGAIFADYITAKMSEDIKNNTIRLGLFRDQKYWYAMLEQAAQIYGRRIDAGEIVATVATQLALDALNNFQICYEVNFPSENDFKAAQDANEKILGDKIDASTNLKEYRQLKVLQGIQQTEVDATTIFSALVQEQLEFMADSAKETLSPIGINPSIDNLKKYFLGTSGMCLGSSLDIDLPEELRTITTPTVMDVGPTVAVVAMADAYELGSTLNQLGTIDPKDLEAGFFFLEKYVVIEDIAEASPGIPMVAGAIPEEILNRSEHTRGVTSLSDWQGFLDSLIDNPSIDTSVPLSEYFGDLSLNDNDELEGSVGVRYGLRLSYALPESLSDAVKAADSSLNSANINAIRDRTYSPLSALVTAQDPGTIDYGGNIVLPEDEGATIEELAAAILAGKYQEEPGEAVTSSYDMLLIPLASTEIDALDMAIDDYGFNAAADSYDVNCMAELLAKEPRLELLLEYVFPLEKLQGLLAVYTARGFVPSIGENDNWESLDDRKDIGSFAGSPKFDNWDQNKTFLKSKEQCRRLFKAMWKSREFSFTDEDSHDVQTNFSENMRDSFGLVPEQDVSWFMRRRSRSSPFDKDGN
tara:strand:- start:3884 stop:10333 length:6450 start_codon:yes stop_codon:yes gene_type:complete